LPGGLDMRARSGRQQLTLPANKCSQGAPAAANKDRRKKHADAYTSLSHKPRLMLWRRKI
jgi:hypothetical protein